ncbi:MAG: Rne/Rng family ribonuclease [Candidatus Protistobacter heckmanni]|nr:Rne/Rng family ribonuclease [Candidatus Protistobacter heckmanni]
MKRMLFNATQQEELRVAIVDGQKLIDIDIETAGREQRKGNIYKGIITRIEPSLEACFVNYGEERHGFLSFKEVARAYFKQGADVRNAGIREALSEGQEIIVQVEKEERGNKGAALTTFISLAGRYLVLMPNNPRGGGVSRRIEGEERQELREVMSQLELPDGMSIIARTAGIGRAAEELQWDLNYLLQLWKAIDEAAGANRGPLLIYLESSLVIRAIRDYFQPDIGEILIDTDDIHEQAQAFMDVVMPDKKPLVKRYQDDVPLFSRFQIEHQIETAYSRTVSLPSGGAIVIDHTEALVSVDVNSARATKGADIEETAARTNLEAADEIARQLRLRDLGGLIVIDFIDMESAKAQKDVEQRLKDALRHDRARVQMGKISRFGLMELSRQRLRPALSEGSHVTCPRCNGTGHIRDTESSALQVLRIIQGEAMKENTAAIHCQVPVEVAAFLLNEKRSEINKIETRFKVNILLIPNKHLETPHYKLERLRHDDPRLDENKASYRIVEEAAREMEADTAYSTRNAEVKPRQEAAVKGITPEQPAPMAAEPRAPRSPQPKHGRDAKHGAKEAAAPVKTVGILGWLKGLFGAGAVQEVPAAPAQAKSERGERNERGNRNERGGRGERQGCGERGERGGRGEARADGRSNEGRGQRQQQAGAQEAQAQNAGENRAERGERGEGQARGEGREGRNRGRGQRQAGAQGEAEQLNGAAALVEAQAGDEAQANAEVQLLEGQNAAPQQAEGEGEERRRRRRNRGRGRREREGQNGEAGENGEVEGGLNEGASVDEVFADAAPAVNGHAAVEDAHQAAYEPAPASAQASTEAAEPSRPAVAKPVDIELSLATAVLVESFLPPPVPPSYSAPVGVEPVPQAEEAVAAPVAQAVVAAPAPAANLDTVLADAGLIWVQTDSDKHRVAQEQAAAMPRPVFAPRERKALPPLSTEPMIQVETSK